MDMVTDGRRGGMCPKQYIASSASCAALAATTESAPSAQATSARLLISSTNRTTSPVARHECGHLSGRWWAGSGVAQVVVLCRQWCCAGSGAAMVPGSNGDPLDITCRQAGCLTQRTCLHGTPAVDQLLQVRQRPAALPKLV